MPFVNIGAGWVYFAHVPKCAGSSVEDYLERRFGQTLGFRDGQFLKVPEAERWSKSSPQHIPAAALARLIPPEMFVAQFAVVRHPLTRLQSVYRFQKVWQETIPPQVSFADWLAGLEGARAAEPFYLDNHVRPMTELVPDGARVFRIEDGTTPIIAWLDRLVGDAEGPRAFRHMKSHKLIHERKGVPVEPLSPSAVDIDLIAEIYAADFARFDYTPDQIPVPAAHRARSARAAGGAGQNLTQGEA